ncbi:MAG: UDP-N-acetylmuramoyl-L-alanyl-D-glutamate--2,6-diaminopimelate ligase [Candidatus Omnitrophica bacterium]|nr:UDP-N-acetylmuramoyl-L-alanyl-D-glutamate--2,6-diaminopimelate ligase [Candidatus Omnitrophota bacterium]
MMLLREVIENVPVLASEGDLNREVTRVVYDSRKVQPGDLFVALRGTQTDGHRYIEQAFQQGASAALVEEPVEGPCWIQVEDTLPLLALTANRVYGDPARQLKLIGVTGSNGKSTTTYLIESILNHGNSKVGLFGTIEYRWPGFSKPAPNTTPLSADLQEGLAAMQREGVDTAVLEVSSHALVLHRVDTVLFDVAVFTNLSHEHLDFHGNMEEYAAAKKLLFTEHLKDDGTAVLNMDDHVSRAWAMEWKNKKVLTYGFASNAAVYPEKFALTTEGISGKIHTPSGPIGLESNLLGRHNLYNLLSAISASLAWGAPISQIEEALAEGVHVPGRLERVEVGQDFRVLVDYAHTPDGLKQVLDTLAELPKNRLICVVGAGGDRDRKKRPLMARIAQELSDIVILTSDNPRTEDPVAILDEMEVGMLGAPGATHAREVDRHKAIEQAIAMAQSGDVVLIAGKGHEDYQEINHVRHPFDDRVEARNALKSRGFAGGEA